VLPAGTLTGFPSGTSNQPSKLGTLGYALRELVTKPAAITPRPGNLFTMNFQGCQGATPPTAGDFTCVVESATAPDGVTPVEGATCTVSLAGSPSTTTTAAPASTTTSTSQAPATTTSTTTSLPPPTTSPTTSSTTSSSTTAAPSTSTSSTTTTSSS